MLPLQRLAKHILLGEKHPFSITHSYSQFLRLLKQKKGINREEGCTGGSKWERVNIDARPGVLGLVSALPQLPLRSLASFLALFLRTKGIRFQSHLLRGERKQLLNYEASLQKSCRFTPVETPWEVTLQYFLLSIGQELAC